jgi:hypothetical protein
MAMVGTAMVDIGEHVDARHKRGDAYKVSHFARKHGISRAQLERIVRRARGSRERANALCTLIKKQFLAA